LETGDGWLLGLFGFGLAKVNDRLAVWRRQTRMFDRESFHHLQK